MVGAGAHGQTAADSSLDTVIKAAVLLTIFDELLDKRADVLMTEAAEALTQQKLKPGLCAGEYQNQRTVDKGLR